MRALMRHFSISSDQDDSDDEGGDSINDGRKKSRKRKRVSNPWRRFLALGYHSLVLPEALLSHLHNHGTDPMKFLIDNGLSEDSLADFAAYTDGDAFVTRYKYTLDL